MDETVTLSRETYDRLKEQAERYKKAKHFVRYTTHNNRNRGEWLVYTDSKLAKKLGDDLNELEEKVDELSHAPALLNKELEQLKQKFDQYRDAAISILKGPWYKRKKGIKELQIRAKNK